MCHSFRIRDLGFRVDGPGLRVLGPGFAYGFGTKIESAWIGFSVGRTSKLKICCCALFIPQLPCLVSPSLQGEDIDALSSPPFSCLCKFNPTNNQTTWAVPQKIFNLNAKSMALPVFYVPSYYRHYDVHIL